MAIRLALLACLALGASAPAAASERNYSVTDFTKVRVDGPYRVTVTTGTSPFAKASGSPAAIDGVSIEVQGQTLVVRTNPSNWGGYPGASPGPVAISVGTHGLTNAWLNGAGSLDVSAVKGQSFDLSLVGSGTMSIARVDVDRLTVAAAGSGAVTLAGRAAETKAVVRGTGSVDGAGLSAKDAIVGAEGSAVVKLTVTGTVKIDTQGTASVEIAGKPACTVRASGSAVVSGCR